jgi:hypothetical protein
VSPSSQIQEPAGMLGLVKLEKLLPVVLLVIVNPVLSRSVPVADLSVEYLIAKSAEGDDPLTTP